MASQLSIDSARNGQRSIVMVPMVAGGARRTSDAFNGYRSHANWSIESSIEKSPFATE